MPHGAAPSHRRFASCCDTGRCTRTGCAANTVLPCPQALAWPRLQMGSTGRITATCGIRPTGRRITGGKGRARCRERQTLTKQVPLVSLAVRRGRDLHLPCLRCCRPYRRLCPPASPQSRKPASSPICLSVSANTTPFTLGAPWLSCCCGGWLSRHAPTHPPPVLRPLRPPSAKACAHAPPVGVACNWKLNAFARLLRHRTLRHQLQPVPWEMAVHHLRGPSLPAGVAYTCGGRGRAPRFRARPTVFYVAPHASLALPPTCTCPPIP